MINFSGSDDALDGIVDGNTVRLMRGEVEIDYEPDAAEVVALCDGQGHHVPQQRITDAHALGTLIYREACQTQPRQGIAWKTLTQAHAGEAKPLDRGCRDRCESGDARLDWTSLC